LNLNLQRIEGFACDLREGEIYTAVEFQRIVDVNGWDYAGTYEELSGQFDFDAQTTLAVSGLIAATNQDDANEFLKNRRSSK
jgi:hypothetical protein